MLRALRGELLARRPTQNDCPALNQRLAHWIQQQWPPVPIAAFYPIRGEANIVPLLQQLDQKGYALFLPEVVAPNTPLQFRQWHPNEAMRCGAFGIPEAQGQLLDIPPALVLVPLVGFTAKGDRLGYGKGFYDRTLAQWQSLGKVRPFFLGVAWDEGEITDPNYRPAPHDVRLDAIITPSRWVQAL